MHHPASVRTPVLLFLLGLACAAGLAACSADAPVAPADTTGDSPQEDPVATVAALAAGDTVTFVETFETGQNVGGWSYGTDHDPVIEQTGGNPDGYLHDDYVISFNPHPGTGPGVESCFTGDWAARNVLSVGIDLRSLDYDGTMSTRYVTLMILNDAGTPLDPSDDWGAYCIGPDLAPSKYVEAKNAPGWRSYDFGIDAQSRSLPAGWQVWRPLAAQKGRTQMTWSVLMTDVSTVRFYYGDPEPYYLLCWYDLGLDNPRITWIE